MICLSRLTMLNYCMCYNTATAASRVPTLYAALACDCKITSTQNSDSPQYTVTSKKEQHNTTPRRSQLISNTTDAQTKREHVTNKYKDLFHNDPTRPKPRHVKNMQEQERTSIIRISQTIWHASALSHDSVYDRE